MPAYKYHWFWKHDVMVKVPPHSPGIKPEREAMPGTPMPPTPHVFTPLRLLMNLKMVEAASPDKKVTNFAPHIILRGRYFQQDLDNARAAGGKLTLGYWDGSQWVPFTTALIWDPKKSKGWAEVTLTHLVDPPLALGT